MARVVWTRRARVDLIRLQSFLAAQSPEASYRAIATIRSTLHTLKNQPLSGTSVAWLPEGYREWFIPFGNSGYVILYRYLENEIVIQALRHGRQGGYRSE